MIIVKQNKIKKENWFIFIQNNMIGNAKKNKR